MADTIERVPNPTHADNEFWLSSDGLSHRMVNGFDVADLVCQFCVLARHDRCEEEPHPNHGYSLCPCNVALGNDTAMPRVGGRRQLHDPYPFL